MQKFFEQTDNMENYLMSHLENPVSEGEERHHLFEEAITKKGISVNDLVNTLNRLKVCNEEGVQEEEDNNIYRRTSIVLQSFYDDLSSQLS